MNGTLAPDGVEPHAVKMPFVGIYAMYVPVYAETHDQLRTHTLLACRDADSGHTRKGLNSVPTKGIVRAFLKGARVGVIPW